VGFCGAVNDSKVAADHTSASRGSSISTKAKPAGFLATQQLLTAPKRSNSDSMSRLSVSAFWGSPPT